jgi:hypothetical protein
MKNIKIIVGVFMMLLSLVACRDEDLNPIPTATILKGVTFTAATTPSFSKVLKVSSVDTDILEFNTNTTNPELIQKMDVYADLVYADKTKATVSKLLQTLPQLVGNVKIPYSQIFTTLGVKAVDLNAGDVIKIKFVATTPDGRTISELNTAGSVPVSGSSAFTRSFNIEVPCFYKASAYGGKWTVKTDDWADYAVGAEIKVTPGPAADQLTLGIYATDVNHKDIVLTISDLNSGAVTVPKQNYGSYTAFLDDGDFFAEGTGTVNGCTGLISLELIHSAPKAAYVSPKLKFILERK